MSTGSKSPIANIPVENKVNRTQNQSQVLKFRVSQVFVGSELKNLKNYYSFENSSRSVSFLIQTMMDETNPVDTKMKRFEYGG